MPIVADHPNSIIKITSPTTEVNMQELADFLEDDLATPHGMCHSSIILPEGKIEDPSNPGVYSQIIIQLDDAWQIQFWGGSGYTRLYGGKLVGGVGGEPMKATGAAGDITVLESPVDGTFVGAQTIGAAVLNGSLASYDIPGSLAMTQMHLAYTVGVYINTIEGESGTTFPLGLEDNPVNNLADAKTIADQHHTRELHLQGNFVVGATDSVNDYVLTAPHDIDTVVVLTPGCTTQNTRFHRLIIMGTFSGKSYVETCTMLEAHNFSGFCIDTVFMDNIAVVDPTTPSLFNMCGGGKVSPPVEIDLNDSSLTIGGWKGEMKLVGKTGSGANIIEMMSGSVTIDSTCIAGTIILKGLGRLVEDNSGSGCEVLSDDLTNPGIVANAVWEHADAAFMLKIINNKRELKKNGLVWELIVYDDNGTTELLNKALKDSNGDNITDLTAGTLARELANSA